MSDFEFRDLGNGRFELSGAMSFETADRILRESAGPFRQHNDIEIDFTGVTDADSAGLALLIEWKGWCGDRDANIRFDALPRSITAIARMTDVEHLI